MHLRCILLKVVTTKHFDHFCALRGAPRTLIKLNLPALRDCHRPAYIQITLLDMLKENIAIVAVVALAAAVDARDVACAIGVRK